MKETTRLVCTNEDCTRSVDVPTLRAAPDGWEDISPYGVTVDVYVREHRALCPIHASVDTANGDDGDSGDADDDTDDSLQRIADQVYGSAGWSTTSVGGVQG